MHYRHMVVSFQSDMENLQSPGIFYCRKCIPCKESYIYSVLSCYICYVSDRYPCICICWVYTTYYHVVYDICDFVFLWKWYLPNTQ